MYRFLLYHPDLKRATQIADPMGWDAERKSYERDPQLHGVFIKYNPELKFVNNGRAVIMQLYKTYGIEADITLTIERKDLKSRAWKKEYEGRLNLTTLQKSKLFATCQVDDRSFYQKIKNRQDVKVNLLNTADLDGGDIGAVTPLSITLHSKTIRRKFTATTATDSTTYALPTGNNFHDLVFDNIISDEVEERFTYGRGFSQLNPSTIDKYLFLAAEGGTYKLNVTLTHLIIQAGALTATMEWFLVTGSPAGYTTLQIGPTHTETSGSGIDMNSVADLGASAISLTNHTVTLTPSDEIYIYARLNVSVTTTATVFDFTIDFDLEADTKIADSTANTLPVFETWQRLIRAVSGKASTFKSDYYARTENGAATDGAGSLRTFLSGEQIRGLATPSLNVSVKELFDSCRAIDGVGMGLEKNTDGSDRIAVEPLLYFYRNSKALRLNFVEDIGEGVAAGYYYNEIEIGYTSWSNRGQQLNNLDEVNTKRNYVLPISQLKKKLSLLSPYIASGYSIEFVRRAAAKKTTDTERDKDIFIVQLRRNASVLVTEKNEGMTISFVIDAATIYNARISPMQNLLRNGSLIRSGLPNQLLKTIDMNQGEGNNAAFITISPAPLVQETSVVVNALPKPLWKPEFYEFMAAPNEDDWAAFEANPYGYVEFSDSDRDYLKGYLISAKKDSESKRVKFKLLAAAL